MTEAPGGSVKPPSADPRAVRSRRMIIDAAVELLAEHGFAGTTVEAIAARSGAAKTTIYRHWPDKRALLLATVEAIVPRVAAPDSGSLRTDLIAFCHDLSQIIGRPSTAALVPALIDAAERDPEVERLLADFTTRREEPARTAVRRAAERGEIAAEGDAERIGELLVGPIMYRRRLSRRPISDEFVEAVVDTFMRVLRR